MSSRKLFLASAILLIAGLTSLWSKWNGSAGITAGTATQEWAVTFNGSVHGWPAMIGVVALFAALITFVVALVRTLLR